MEGIRCFIAIELPPEVKTALDFLEERLKEGRHPFIKWVSPESIHITLKFLGNISPDAVTPIADTLVQSAKVTKPFELRIGNPGAFPNWRRPQVVWVGIEDKANKLILLQKSIEERLIPLGFKPESRPFTPHLTLGRLRENSSHHEGGEFGKWACSLHMDPQHPFTVESLSLMESTLTPKGAIHTRLKSIHLLNS